MMGFAPQTIAIVALMTLTGGLVKSTLGIGFGLLSTPLLLLVLEPKTAVAVAVPLIMAQDVLIAFQMRRYVEWRRILPLAIPSVITVPLGTFILRIISPTALTLVIAGLIVVGGILMLSGLKVYIRRESLASSLVGLLSGVLLPIASISGPPVAMFLVNQGWERNMMRATLATYLIILEATVVASYYVAGVLTASSATLIGLMVPVVLVAFAISIQLVRRLNTRIYHRLTVIVIIVSGVIAIVSAVVKL